MRKSISMQTRFDCTTVENVKLNLNCRDEMIPILRGLQQIYSNRLLQKKILKSRSFPYKHGRIPVAQLRYYPNGDDSWGESEVEPVISLWRAIQANLCAYLETINNSMRPPLKIVAARTRIETIEYGPGAQWLMDDPNAVQEAVVGTQAIGQSITYALNGSTPTCTGGMTCVSDDNKRHIDFDGNGTIDYTFTDRDFSVKSLIGNAVLRWEYRPGSTLFVVWQRRQSQTANTGRFDFAKDAPALFRAPAENVIMLKASYWLGF